MSNKLINTGMITQTNHGVKDLFINAFAVKII